MNGEFNPQFSRIGEILVHQQKISESQLNEALVQQKNTHEKLGQTLMDMNFINEDDLMTVYSMQLGYKKADNFILLDADSTVAAM
ncbi:MAG: pilus assembly protein PilB, partial [Candidatus Neomarinimicrobiota bacterium]|nr:pilus assembly protein PilB [Candidatus Neomarinimicrobiota bacterium]